MQAAGEQAQRAEHNADNGKLIGAALAQLGMGVIDQPARKNIRKSVDDLLTISTVPTTAGAMPRVSLQ